MSYQSLIWKEGTTGQSGHWEVIPVYSNYNGKLIPGTSVSGKVVKL